jgi:flagellar hook-length control protein FliK
MTWGDLMHEVKKKVTTSESTKKQETTTSDQTQMLAFFQNMGFTADESQQLLDSLAKGETSAVWNKVKAKVAAMGQDSTLSLDGNEVAAIAKGLNLSEDAQIRLTALFDQAGTLTKQGLDTAVSIIQGEITTQLAKESQSLEGFKQAAAPVLAQAWQKNGSKKHSDLHEDDVARKAAQAVSLGGAGKEGEGSEGTAKPIIQSEVNVTADMPETARTKAREAAGEKHAAETKAEVKAEVSAEATQAKTAVDLDKAADTEFVDSKFVDAKLADQNQTTPDKGKEAAHTASHANQSQNVLATAGNAVGGQADQFNQGARDGQEGWGQFWNKVRSEGVASGTGSTASTEQVGPGAMGLMNTATEQQGKNARLADPGLAQRAARQLETGLLKNASQGSKQLTLTLNPDELGKLSVTLTVKDKEVQATITADKGDTAAMLQEQAAKIKQNLESQGFKVTKLDVQTSLAQDNQGWNGAEQHNMAREQRQAMERARTSMRLSQLGGGLTSEAESITIIPGAMATQGAGLDLFT